MKVHFILAATLAGFLSVVGCQKASPAASRPAPPAPVAAATPNSNPAPVARRTPATTATRTNQPATQAPRSATITPQERATLNARLAKLEDALFDYDRAAIRPDASTALKADVEVVRGILANYPNQKLLIEGDADERGSDEYNLALGDKRARAAEDFLASMGIPNTQLAVVSYGKERPVCTESTESCWQRNRRAHITAAP